MPHDVPAELAELLAAPDCDRQEVAWAAFVRAHTRLLLHVARSYGGDHDAVMDRYTFILDKLRADDYRRLRSWVGDRRSKLTTWLVIVAQRLSLDENRHRYGRPRGRGGADTVDTRQTRRRLADLVAEQVDHVGTEAPVAGSTAAPDLALQRSELSDQLTRCLAALSPADRLLLSLRFEDGLSAAAIARSLRFPTPFHVYRQLERLLKGLRMELRNHGVDGSEP